MKRASSIHFAAAAAATLLQLTGCSGPQEDVRIGFCKDLVTVQLGEPTGLEWGEARQEIRRPEYARITLDYVLAAAGDGSKQAACTYDYATTDENVMHQVDPLSAYATVPSAFTLDGKTLSEKELNATVLKTAERQGKGLLDGLLGLIAATAERLWQAVAQ